MSANSNEVAPKTLPQREATDALPVRDILSQPGSDERPCVALHRSEVESLENQRISRSSVVVTRGERTVTLALLLFGLIPVAFSIGYLLVFHPATFDAKQFALIFLLGIFGYMVMELYPIVILWGFQRLSLPPEFVKWLGIATIGGVAGLLATVYGYLFKL